MIEEKREFRLDFKQEIVNIDEKTGVITFALIPDPERYDEETRDGVKGYYDRFDNVFIPLDVLENAAPQLKEKPIYYNPPKIENVDEYINERIQKIDSFFESESEDFGGFCDVSEDFLEKLTKNKMRFVILSIDLKGSTKMSQTLTDEQNSKIISLFLREMTLIVKGFNGYVLKYLGDGLLAYFPEPNFIGMNDNALDCAVTLKKMIINGINPVLIAKKLPPLTFRIGLDSGEAMIKTLGAENIKINKDLIGKTLNFAAKIQSVAKDNQILMGESTALNVHTMWRKIIKKLETPKSWSHRKSESGEIYPIYYLEY